MGTHVKVIGVIFAIIGAMLAAAAFFTPLVLGLVAGIVGNSGDPDAAVGATVLGFAGLALSAILAVLAIPYMFAAWGLIKLKPWARILSIILAALCLTKIPFGTIFGIYALIILFKKETEALFTAPA